MVIQNHWSRRKFIGQLSATGAVVMLKPLWPKASYKNIDPGVAEIVAKTIGIDTHNHIDVPLDTDELPGPTIDLPGEMKKSGLSAIVMTFATDYKRNVQPREAYQRFLNGLTAMDAMLQNNNMKRSLNRADVQSAHDNHQPTVIQAIEGCHFLEGNTDRVEVAYKRGLRHLGLLHDSDASVPLGDVYTNAAKYNGLTDFGSQVIREANRLGMLIDLTHGSNETINMALKISTTPVIITHTGLDTQLGSDERMSQMMKPRLISKEQAKIVADTGGVIGVWTHLSDTPLQYAQNIKAMVDVIGIDHVCIGTDTKLTTPYRSPNDMGGKPQGPPPGSNPDNKQDSFKQNKKPPNFPNNGQRIGERTNEAWANEKVGFYYAVVNALLQTGFNEKEIGKIGGGNYLRVFNAATSVH